MKRKQLASVVLAVLVLGIVASLFVHVHRSSPLLDNPAPDFTLPVGVGEGAGVDRLRLSDLRGEVVLLDFWASWCGPCQRSVPELNRVLAKYRDRGVQVIGINSESIGPGYLRFTAARWGMRYPTLTDREREAALAYGVDAYPTLFLIDRGGVVRKVFFGAPGALELEAEIESVF